MVRELADALRSRWQAGLRAARCVGIPLLAGVAAGRAAGDDNSKKRGA